MTLMQAYQDAKNRHPGMLLLFRMGDFYELFGEDAETAARILGLCLTQRTDKNTREKVFLAGFPRHALENYLHHLLKAGRHVAVCDQVEEVQLEETAEKVRPTLFDEVKE
jgi:DNA mismatch repair protein MutS